MTLLLVPRLQMSCDLNTPAVVGEEEGRGKARVRKQWLKSKGQRKKEVLPLTGPMYIISEAGMKRERVRKTGKTGKRWREEVK